jgi:hypothetical protein
MLLLISCSCCNGERNDERQNRTPAHHSSPLLKCRSTARSYSAAGRSTTVTSSDLNNRGGEQRAVCAFDKFRLPTGLESEAKGFASRLVVVEGEPDALDAVLRGGA